jgi:hypothetical protein
MKRTLQFAVWLAASLAGASAQAAIAEVQAKSAAAGSVTFNSTATSGHLLVACGHRDGSTTAPSLPTGYTTIASAGANSNSMRIAYKISDGTETSVSMTNATSIGVIELSGQHATSPIGANAAGGAASTSMAYNAVTFNVADGSSWALACGGHRTATNVNTAPTGMTLRTGSGTTDFMMADSNGGVSGWSTYVVEIKRSESASADGESFISLQPQTEERLLGPGRRPSE